MIAPMSDITWALDTNYRAIGSVGKLVQAFEAVEGCSPEEGVDESRRGRHR